MASLVVISGIQAARHPMVFSPYTSLESQIKAAASGISSYFDEIDSALDKGARIKKAVTKEKIEPVMRRLITSSRLLGYQHASAISKKKMPALYGKEIKDVATRRAAKVDKLMRRTTRRVLKNSPESEYILSGERGLAAARFEASRAYFRGMRDALAGSGLGKAWNTAGGDSCEDCLDNEDDGVIGVDEMFSSGDFYPGIHLNCSCFITLSRL